MNVEELYGAESLLFTVGRWHVGCSNRAGHPFSKDIQLD